MKKFLVLIPVYNEAKNLEAVIKELKKDLSSADILVIDDCSDDTTLDVIKKLGINYLSLPFNLGYSSALQTGFKYAVNKGYDYVLQFDGDGQHIASEGKKLCDTIIKEKADIVIGSRFIEKSTYRHPFLRMLGSKIFQWIIWLLSRKSIYDPTSGFQILNKRVFEKYSRMHNYPDYPDANVLIEMIFNKYKIIEVPVEMRKRKYGVSMHEGLLSPFKYMINMFYSIFIIFIKYMPISFLKLIRSKMK